MDTRIYIVHQGRPGHVQRQQLVEGLDAARALVDVWIKENLDKGIGRYPGIVGFTRAHKRQSGSGQSHWQAGRYSIGAHP